MKPIIKKDKSLNREAIKDFQGPALAVENRSREAAKVLR